MHSRRISEAQVTGLGDGAYVEVRARRGVLRMTSRSLTGAPVKVSPFT